jgi:hypothetical protein
MDFKHKLKVLKVYGQSSQALASAKRDGVRPRCSSIITGIPVLGSS